MRDKLIDYGMIGRTQIKNLPDHLIHHFIRGLFDGDGSITSALDKWNKRRYRFALVGNKELLLWVQNKL